MASDGSKIATALAGEVPVDRNRYKLRAEDFWIDNTEIGSKRRGAATSTYFRTGASHYLDFLAFEVTQNRADWSELRHLLWVEFSMGGFGRRWPRILEKHDLETKALCWCEVSSVLLLEPASHVDATIGLVILSWAVPKVPRKLASCEPYREFLMQALIAEAKFEEAQSFLKKAGWLPPAKTAIYSAQIGHAHSLDLECLNDLFVTHGDIGLQYRGEFVDRGEREYGFPYRFESTEPKQASSARALSVVVPVTEQWELEFLEDSLFSIRQQTAKPEEIVVVLDEALSSETKYRSYLRPNADRVLILPVDTDQGTALRVGIEKAAGDVVCVQLPNQISHPRRFEIQMAELESSGAEFSYGEVLEFDLSFRSPALGYGPLGPAGSTLCFNKRITGEVGNLVAAGKIAQSEFLDRLRIAYSDPSSGATSFPLAVQCVEERGSFPLLYDHSTEEERLFRSSAAEFHSWLKGAPSSEVCDDGEKRVVIPDGLLSQGTVRELDVIIAGDWRKYGGPQKSMIEEIHALVRAGLRVGVLHMEAARFMTVHTDNLCLPIQRLVNEREVELVTYGAKVRSKLLILRYPPILQVVCDEPAKISTDRMIILANQAPSELDGSDVRYTVPEATAGAIHCFGVRPTWVPQGPQVREAIAPYLSKEELEPFNMPGILNPEEWEGEMPRRNLNRVPVIGRHSRDNAMKWPEDRKVLEAAYPITGPYLVRSMGGTSYAQKVLGVAELPANWESLARDEEPVVDFLHSLDYYVFYQHSNAIEAFGRSILEAIAANLVVILQQNYSEVFGDAAIYANPENVQDIVKRFQENPEMYVEQQKKAATVICDEFSYESYVRRIESIMARPRTMRSA